MAKEERPLTCACGSGMPYTACCGRYHAGDPAPNSEALMRARYTGYAMQFEEYLFASWHASTRPVSLA